FGAKISTRFDEPPYDVEDAVPRSSENIIIELNVDDNPEIGYPVIHLDLNQFFEDDEARDIGGVIQGHVISGGKEIFNEFDGGNGEAGETSQGNVQGRKNMILTDVERWAVYHALLENSVNGKLKKNTTKAVKDMFNIELRTVQRVWKIHKRMSPGSDVDVSTRKARVVNVLSVLKHIFIDKVSWMWPCFAAALEQMWPCFTNRTLVC
ncbi:transposon protein, partial [Striga asiatica]